MSNAQTTITHAVRTGRTFAAIHVDLVRTQCTRRSDDRGGRYAVSGVGQASVSECVRYDSGEYRTLRELMADYPDATRSRHYDID